MVSRDKARLERVIAVLVIVLPIVIGVPVAIVNVNIPASFTAHKLAWIFGLVATCSW